MKKIYAENRLVTLSLSSSSDTCFETFSPDLTCKVVLHVGTYQKNIGLSKSLSRFQGIS